MSAPQKLSTRAFEACTDLKNELYLSVVSAWEILIKEQIGKLRLTVSLEDMLSRQREQNFLKILSVELDHVLSLGTLPPHHGDPFDRLLIAQAQIESLTLVTRDTKIGKYSANVLW